MPHGKGEKGFHRLCPWWMGYILLSPLRRLRQNPARILGGLVREGMTVLEVGPGMGFFSLELARLVGASGRVIAVDIQPRMLKALERRAKRAGVAERLDLRLAPHGGMGVEDANGKVDFVLAFYVVHELPDAGVFFREAAAVLKPGGTILIAEPSGHVKEEQFEQTVQLAKDAGFMVVERPEIPVSRAVLMGKAG